MNAPLIWLHEEALRITHPVFSAAPQGTKAVYVWDDDYFRRAHYSLKRLVFIYEALCGLPADILHGEALGIAQKLAPPLLFIPETNNPLIASTINALKTTIPVQLIADEPFATIENPTDYRRFSQYWKHAQKTAFQPNAGKNAPGA